METRAIKSAALYIRVSTEQQKDGDSLREQRETLQEYARQKGYVVHSIYIDDGVSGQKLNRSEFQRLMQDVEARKIDIILFTKLDRWFRSMRHYLNTQATLEKYGVAWTAVRQDYYDTTTAYGRAFVQQSMIWAELEAQNDSDRIKATNENKIANGEVVSGKTPLGYSIVDKHLQPNEDAEKVLAIFKYFDRTGSLNRTIAFMETEYGITTSQSNLKKSILTNTKYIGINRNNVNFCPPIIPKDLFDRVQSNLSRNIKCSQKRNYIFSGMVRCACCGSAASGYPQNTRAHGKTYKYNSYRCRKAFTNKRCNNRKHLSENILERYLIDNLQDLLADHLLACESANEPQRDTEKQRKTLEKKIEKLKELYVNDLITIDEYKADREKYLQQIESLEKPAEIKNLQPMYDFLELDLKKVCSELSPEERRYFWRSIIKEIYYDAERIFTVIF